MKKLLVFVFMLIDIIMLIICLNLNSDYNKKNEILSSMLINSDYNDTLYSIELEKNNILNDIKNEIGVNLEGVDTFDEIKIKLDNNYNELNEENVELVNRREQLVEQNNTLKKTYIEILEEEEQKKTYMISNVPKINQYSIGYPTGCESAALRNLLNFWGVSVSMKEIVDILPKGDLPYYEGEVRYGGNPELEFIGHPTSYSSYGVYEKPIKDVANVFKSGIIDGTGMSLDDVLGVVREGRPVIVWVSMNMAVPYLKIDIIHMVRERYTIR